MISTGKESTEQIVVILGLSFLLAFLLWVSVAIERSDESFITVSVVTEHLPAGKVLAAPPPDHLELKVSGPRVALMRMDWARPVCRLDLAGTAAGEIAFRSPETLVHLDREVKVVSVFPSAIVLSLKDIKAGGTNSRNGR